jgi:transcriptional regulator with XRE-family HTH domain
MVPENRKIRSARRRARLTQRQLAAASGVASGTISRLESKGDRPNIHTLSKLSEALQVPPSVLLPDEE